MDYKNRNESNCHVFVAYPKKENAKQDKRSNKLQQSPLKNNESNHF